MGDQPNPAPAGYCGLRSPPSWKPKPQREGRGGEERVGRGVESRGEQRTSMEPCSRVRVAKCQMLATSLFVLLLGSAMAATAALSYFGPHFAVIGPVSADRTTYEALRHGGLPELCPGVLRPSTGGLLEGPQPHSGGGRRAGRLRPGLRAGAEERIRKQAAGAGGHPGHVPVLWQELAPWAPGGLGSRPVSGGGGCQTGLPAADPELPEGAQEHRLHPDWPGPRLHGPATTLPRSPESTGASRRDPRLRAHPKRTLPGAI
nr:tetraspanin-32 isoform X17 [Bubalus bubalis]